MKLSHSEPERADEVVPKISEFANSQNKVNAADFFAEPSVSSADGGLLSGLFPLARRLFPRVEVVL